MTVQSPIRYLCDVYFIPSNEGGRSAQLRDFSFQSGQYRPTMVLTPSLIDTEISHEAPVEDLHFSLRVVDGPDTAPFGRWLCLTLEPLPYSIDELAKIVAGQSFNLHEGHRVVARGFLRAVNCAQVITSDIVALDYTLGQAGWANLLLKLGDASVALGQFGYCCDSLGHLVRGALGLATNRDGVDVYFDGEPLVWQLTVEKSGNAIGTSDAVRVRVFDYHEPSVARLLLEGYCTSDTFADAVAKAACKVWDTYGAEDYDARWLQNGFPLRALRALEAALATQEAVTPYQEEVGRRRLDSNMREETPSSQRGSQ